LFLERFSNNLNDNDIKVASQSAQAFMAVYQTGLWPRHACKAHVHLQVASTTHNAAGAGLDDLMDVAQIRQSGSPCWTLVTASPERVSRLEPDMWQKVTALSHAGISWVSAFRATGEPRVLLPGMITLAYAAVEVGDAFFSRSDGRINGLAPGALAQRPTETPGRVPADDADADEEDVGSDVDSDAAVDDGAFDADDADDVQALAAAFNKPAKGGGTRNAFMAGGGGGGTAPGGGTCPAAGTCAAGAGAGAGDAGDPPPDLDALLQLQHDGLTALRDIKVALALHAFHLPLVDVPSMGPFLRRLAVSEYAPLSAPIALLRSNAVAHHALDAKKAKLPAGSAPRASLEAEMAALVRVRGDLEAVLEEALEAEVAPLLSSPLGPGYGVALRVLDEGLRGKLEGALSDLRRDAQESGEQLVAYLGQRREDVQHAVARANASAADPARARVDIEAIFDRKYGAIAYADSLLTVVLAYEGLLEVGGQALVMGPAIFHTEKTLALASIAKPLIDVVHLTQTTAGGLDSLSIIMKDKGMDTVVDQVFKTVACLAQVKEVKTVVVVPFTRISRIQKGKGKGSITKPSAGADADPSLKYQEAFLLCVIHLAKRMCDKEGITLELRPVQAYMGSVFAEAGASVESITDQHPLQQALAAGALVNVDMVVFTSSDRIARNSDVARWVDEWGELHKMVVSFLTVDDSLLNLAAAGKGLLACALGDEAPEVESVRVARELAKVVRDHRLTGFKRGGPSKPAVWAVGHLPGQPPLSDATKAAFITYASKSAASVSGSLLQMGTFKEAAGKAARAVGSEDVAESGGRLYNDVLKKAEAASTAAGKDLSWCSDQDLLSGFAPIVAGAFAAEAEKAGMAVEVTSSSSFSTRRGAKDRVRAYMDMRLRQLPSLQLCKALAGPIPLSMRMHPANVGDGVTVGVLCCRQRGGLPSVPWDWGQVISCNQVPALPGAEARCDWKLHIVYYDGDRQDDVGVRLSALAAGEEVPPHFLVLPSRVNPLNLDNRNEQPYRAQNV